MQLGFVSAILPELDLPELFSLAHDIGYTYIEVMCWPLGKAERKYAGVTHIDIQSLTSRKIQEIQDLQKETGINISGLGYYPNPLTPDVSEAKVYIDHIYRLIDAAAALGIYHANTFIGRDWTKTIMANWKGFDQIWPDIVTYAEQREVYIGIENCPMFFSDDEWPGGKNMAISPQVWRAMFDRIPSPYFGLNFDPSHLILQHIDVVACIQEFGADRFHHVHAKDLTIEKERLNEVGIFANPLEWHDQRIPGHGDVNWSSFFDELKNTGYVGPVCVEVEDKAYEHSLEGRIQALRDSYAFLKQYL